MKSKVQVEKRRPTVQKKRKRQALPMALVGVGLILLSLVALGIVLGADQPPGVSPSEDAAGLPSAVPVSVEFPAPELLLVDLNDNPVRLADFKGQTVLLNNWAIWCPPCKAEMPILQAYHSKYQEQGFTIIGIEAGEQPDGVAAFVDEHRLTFPIWPDPQQLSMRAFQAFSLPNSYVIDRSGVVRLAWTGAISEAMLEKYVTPLLRE